MFLLVTCEMIVVDPHRVLMMSELSGAFILSIISYLISGGRHSALAVSPVMALKHCC